MGSSIKYCGLTIKSGISRTKIVVHWRYTEWDVMRICIYIYTYIFSPNQMVIQNANSVWIFTMAWMTSNQDYIIIHPFGTSFLQPQVAILTKKRGWNIIPTNFTDKSIFRTDRSMGEIETIAMLFFWGGWGLAGDQKRDGSRMGAAN